MRPMAHSHGLLSFMEQLPLHHCSAPLTTFLPNARVLVLAAVFVCTDSGSVGNCATALRLKQREAKRAGGQVSFLLVIWPPVSKDSGLA
jgi:hypothetical protein